MARFLSGFYMNKPKLTGKRCKCPSCGEYFSTVSNFDKHRKGSHADNDRHCVSPDSVGLEQNGRGLWAMPGTPRDYEPRDYFSLAIPERVG